MFKPKKKLNLLINNLKRDIPKIRGCDKSEENLTINTRYRKEMKYSRAYIRQTYGPALKTIIPRHYGVVWSYKKKTSNYKLQDWARLFKTNDVVS